MRVLSMPGLPSDVPSRLPHTHTNNSLRVLRIDSRFGATTFCSIYVFRTHVLPDNVVSMKQVCEHRIATTGKALIGLFFRLLIRLFVVFKSYLYCLFHNMSLI